jgi:hypothetical protein
MQARKPVAPVVIDHYVHEAPDADPTIDSRPGHYYVSVCRCNNNAGIGADHRLLRGPFVNDHGAALTAVAEARVRACKLDRRGEWYAYGTFRSEDDLGPGILDRLESALR